MHRSIWEGRAWTLNRKWTPLGKAPASFGAGAWWWTERLPEGKGL